MELPPLISGLLDPASYPAAARGPVELIQTHVSYILLTPEFVYKIKKPVDFGFLDFTTLEKRLRYCEEEVRLNRRLAPGVYLGVVRVTEEGGRFRMEGEAQTVEYAVKMRRIPAESLLEHRLAEGTANAETIERVARVIAAFHARAQDGERVAAFGSPEAIRRNTEENFAQTGPFVGRTISRRLFAAIKAYTEGFMRVHEGLFLKRMREGFIRDCHGDLHSEHISVNGRVEVFDCIEFNERFRLSDVVADAAFLSMDLDHHNRHDLTLAFERAYFNASGDKEGVSLLDFYKCYRAYVRGKVEGFKSAEPEVGEREKRRSEMDARRHFHLSGLYASGGWRPEAVVVRGLPGTGKSTVARALADRTGLVHLSTDRIRKELAGIPPEEHRQERFGEGIYSAGFTEKVYRELLDRAEALMREGRSVILDATFSKARFIEAALVSARNSGAAFHVIECEAGDEVVRERLVKRRAEVTVSDAGVEVYRRQKEGYERWEGPSLRLTTTAPAEELVSRVSREVFG
ncbi:MAG: AAA family ATPase [Thermodesulfobacteriota bacterium]